MILEMSLLGYQVLQIPAVMHMRTIGTGMHSGLWKPVNYMVRSTVAVAIARIRVGLRRGRPALAPGSIN